MAKMLTVKYFEQDGSLDLLNVMVSSASRSKVVYTSPVSGAEIVIQGKNLRMDDGFLDRGIITKLTILDGNGSLFQIHSGFKVNADHIWADTTPLEYAVAVIATSQFRNTKHLGSETADTIQALKGNDILLGRGGDDTLAGGAGNDRLTGGEGNDTFVFNAAGLGRDTIRDFDADGGTGNQDLIKGVFANATMSQVGANTVLDFGDGDILTLLNVNSSQITTEDFVA